MKPPTAHHSPNLPSEAVHWAISLVAKEGRQAELDARLVDLAKRSLDLPGVTGVHLMRPPEGSDSREFHLHRSFLNREESRRFYESQLFQDYQREAGPLIEGRAVVRPLHGFEAFFREGAAVPPRWKMAVLTWLAVYPSVLLVSLTVAPLLESWPLPGKTAVLTMLVVLLLAWVIMPRLTRWSRTWLRPELREVHLGAPVAADGERPR
ncbi:hypothetical protein KOR34_27790 [Posidoniimonas corsicana]|uniref:Antibiotic biosynthesis monooxygenase n=1 Tax=Posidoniimonas corsicana TaxID=1938618 RepID=A0A5C5VJ37_9BACT|nr:antibiotic biosynthesis monooxygenase [Posidoniimonas corsicana]TWT37815.1 hypothetical protein KOR34_27790 [Posidoniimonas corsicana]